MAGVIRLYPPSRVNGQSFKGVKRCTVPNQSLSLVEIVKRFVRREPLPMLKEGIYEDRFGDLEKLKNADVTEQLERAEELKAQIANWNKRIKDKQDRLAKIKADMDAAALSTPSTPGGGTTIKSPPPQGA